MSILPQTWKERREKRKKELKQIGTSLKDAFHELKELPKKVSGDIKNKLKYKSDKVREIENKFIQKKILLILLFPLGLFLSWLFYPSYSLIAGVWIGVIMAFIVEINQIHKLKKEKVL